MLKEKLAEIQEAQEALEKEHADLTEKAKETQKELEVHCLLYTFTKLLSMKLFQSEKHETSNYKRIVEKLEGNITDLNEQLLGKEKVISDQIKTIEANQKQILKVDIMLKEQKMEIDKLNKELTASNQRYQKLRVENNVLHTNFDEAKKDLKNKTNELKVT